MCNRTPPVFSSSVRYQTCPSGEVLKWSSAHSILKLSSKEEFFAASEKVRPSRRRRAATFAIVVISLATANRSSSYRQRRKGSRLIAIRLELGIQNAHLGHCFLKFIDRSFRHVSQTKVDLHNLPSIGHIAKILLVGR